MTVGVMWEFVEFSADKLLQFDMQKDTIIQQINSVELSKDGNTVYHVPDITRTIIESQNADGKTDKTIIQNGYLDVGIMDTMKVYLLILLEQLFSVYLVTSIVETITKNLRSSRILFLKKSNDKTC